MKIAFSGHGNYRHHRRNSSVTSLSASAAKNPQKIERLQAFDKWRISQTDPCPHLNITTIYVRHGNFGNFVIECCGPTGHWMIEKSLKQIYQFQKNLELVFPVEAGVTGKPRILPKLLFPKCPRWLLLKKEIYCWYRYQIERFMLLLLECSLLVAKSKLTEEFLDSDHLTSEEVEMNGKKLTISAPLSDRSVLRCTLGNIDVIENQKHSIITIIYENEVYPLVNIQDLVQLEQTFSVLFGPKQFYAINGDDRVAIDQSNFSNFNGKSNQLLFMEILHEK